MNVQLSLTGVEQIDQVIRGLPLIYSHRVIQAAYTEAAKPMVNRMHLLAPVGRSGRTADSVGTIKIPFARATAIGEVQAGPRRGRFGGQKAHWLEFGTAPRKFRGANRGVIDKQPFVEPAFEQTHMISLGTFSEILGNKTFQFMKRTIRNAQRN